MSLADSWPLSLVAISYPAYTGTVGFGQKYVEELLGKIGTLDIQDCIASVRHLIELGLTKEGAGYQYLYGGSHGGFIIGHRMLPVFPLQSVHSKANHNATTVIGQYPDLFSGAVLRNPVISLGDVWSTDIPDWYFEES